MSAFGMGLLAFAVLAGVLLACTWRLLLRSGQLEALARAIQDALERARTSLSAEIQSGVISLQSVVATNVNELGHRLTQQLNDSRRDQTDALGGIHQLLSTALEEQSSELSNAQLQLRDRLGEAQRNETETLRALGEKVGTALADAPPVPIIRETASLWRLV